MALTYGNLKGDHFELFVRPHPQAVHDIAKMLYTKIGVNASNLQKQNTLTGVGRIPFQGRQFRQNRFGLPFDNGSSV